MSKKIKEKEKERKKDRKKKKKKRKEKKMKRKDFTYKFGCSKINKYFQIPRLKCKVNLRILPKES